MLVHMTLNLLSFVVTKLIHALNQVVASYLAVMRPLNQLCYS